MVHLVMPIRNGIGYVQVVCMWGAITNPVVLPLRRYTSSLDCDLRTNGSSGWRNPHRDRDMFTGRVPQQAGLAPFVGI